MDVCSPLFKILKEIRQLGCENEAQCSAAYRLYIHLCEERHLWDVQYYYSKQLNLIYLTARKQQDSSPEVYIPVPTFEGVSMTDIDRYQTELTTSGGSDGSATSVIIAFCDPSSSVLLYKLTNTVKPLEEKPLSKNKMAKQRAKANKTGDS
ncbi:uncharacterized protein LOC109408743 [Aedes albopictus]|uniref:tRNA-splicing endonuclease subunit Sen15 domain-containing protein n=1 Tax=Aedes albopictus TaxID=7160 RepID=A0ABM1ZRX3_AEDAL